MKFDFIKKLEYLTIFILVLSYTNCFAVESIICASLNKYPYTVDEQYYGPSGFCLDVVKSAAKFSNLNINIKEGTYEQVISWLEDGTVDCVPFLNDSDSNCLNFDLSAINMLVIQGDFVFKQNTPYVSYKSLHGEKVGFIKDDIAARAIIDQLMENNVDYTPVWYDSFAVLNNDIIYGKIKYGIVSEYIKSGHIDKELKRINSQLLPVRITLGFSKAFSAHLANKLVDAIINLKNYHPAEYQRIIKKHSSDYGVEYGLIVENSSVLVFAFISLLIALLVLFCVLIYIMPKYRKYSKEIFSDFYKNCKDLQYVYMNLKTSCFFHKVDPASSDYFIVINHASVDFFQERMNVLNFDDIFEFSDSTVSISSLIQGMQPMESKSFNVRLKSDSDSKYKFELVTQILASGTEAFSVINNRSEEEALLASLQASQYDLEMATEAGKVGVFEFDVATMVMTGNNQCFINLGLEYIEAGISSNDIFKIVEFEDPKYAKNIFRKLISGKVKACTLEFKVRSESGRTEWMSLNAKAKNWGSDGVAKRIVGVLVNIDQIKKLNLELEEFSRNFELLMNVSPDNIYAKDTNYRFLWSSLSHTIEHGFHDRNEIVGKNDYDLHNKEDADKFIEVEREVIENGRSIVGYEQTYLLTNGERKWVLATKVPINDSSGNVVGLLGINTDITKYKNVIKTLNNTQRIQAIGKLAGGIAHEFNNALNGIMGFAHLLQGSKCLKDKEQEYVDYILKGTDRCEELTRHFLAFARKGKYVETIVDIHELIIKTIEIIKLSMSSNIEIECNLKAVNYHVTADLNQLENVIINLVANAEYAVNGQGHILIETSNILSSELNGDLKNFDIELPQSIEIKIIDDGEGISPENLDKIFDPFFTTKKVGEGAGLGLSAVYGIVVNHKGTIGIESDLGVGTCFTIILPVI